MGRKNHNKQSNILNIILISILVVEFFSIAFIAFNRLELQGKEEIVVSDEDIFALRRRMSDIAVELTDRQATGDELVETVDAMIEESSKTIEVKKNLKRYFIYIALRHGFPEGAYYRYRDYFTEFVDDEFELPASERCELYEYRKMINVSFKINEDMYSEEANELNRTTQCDRAMSEEKYQKKEGESDYDYAYRIYYSGIITKGVELFATQYGTGTDEQNEQSRIDISDYYYIHQNYKKYSKYTMTKRKDNNSSEGI